MSTPIRIRRGTQAELQASSTPIKEGELFQIIGDSVRIALEDGPINAVRSEDFLKMPSPEGRDRLTYVTDASNVVKAYPYSGSINPNTTFPVGTKGVALGEGVTGLSGGGFPTALESVVLPSSLTTLGGYCFLNCANLTSIEIPAGVTTIATGAFYYSGITDIKMHEGLVQAHLNHAGDLTSVTLPNTVGDFNFQQCWSLTSVNLPNSITTLGDYCFSGCGALPSLEIPSTVTEIGANAFYYCAALTTLDLPEGLTTIDYGAFDSSGLTSLVIPSTVTSVGSWAFTGCTGLTSIDVRCPQTSLGATSFGSSSIATVHALASDASWTAGAGQTIAGKTGITVIKDLT